MEIKKAAKMGNKEACGVLAKQLVNLRKQKTKSYAMGAKISGISGKILNTARFCKNDGTSIMTNQLWE